MVQRRVLVPSGGGSDVRQDTSRGVGGHADADADAGARRSHLSLRGVEPRHAGGAAAGRHRRPERQL